MEDKYIEILETMVKANNLLMDKYEKDKSHHLKDAMWALRASLEFIDRERKEKGWREESNNKPSRK